MELNFILLAADYTPKILGACDPFGRILYSRSLSFNAIHFGLTQEVTRLTDLAEILHAPISAPTVRFHKIFEAPPGFFVTRCAKKKPGRASKICDKARNVQILAHAKSVSYTHLTLPTKA